MKVNFYSGNDLHPGLMLKALLFMLVLHATSSVSANNSQNKGNPDTWNNLRKYAVAKISAFSAISANGEYQLTWETVTENNVKQYDVEYSYNNRDFQRAGIVNAANRTFYTYNHTTSARPSMFYRLKIIDNDGSSVYSNVITVSNSLAKPDDFIAPTIIRDGVLNITLTNSYKNLQVFNSAGVEVFQENVGERTGNRLGFTLPELPAGAYFVKLIGNGISITRKVMII
ncbi:MAG TPA: T9SS type A sorting domain-containing protein [Flavitalea sp.]|nr:T9SS type A sorting domain-containing protein [Flavitalea sp.]